MAKQSVEMLFKAIPRQHVNLSKEDVYSLIQYISAENRGQKKDPIQEFEESFAAYIGVPYAISVSSARAAFSLIMEALDIRDGDEIILPAFNFSIFPKILMLKNIIPVFVDIDRDTLTIDC
mgnify:FL=1